MSIAEARCLPSAALLHVVMQPRFSSALKMRRNRLTAQSWQLGLGFIRGDILQPELTILLATPWAVAPHVGLSFKAASGLNAARCGF